MTASSEYGYNLVHDSLLVPITIGIAGYPAISQKNENDSINFLSTMRGITNLLDIFDQTCALTSSACLAKWSDNEDLSKSCHYDSLIVQSTIT